jgi:alpha-ketoglutarate-dependent taurine dioxygenase
MRSLGIARVRTRPLSPRGGLLVQAPSGARLEQLDRNGVIDRFRVRGLLELRGFAPDDAAFHALTRRFTARFVVDRTAGRVSQAIAPEVQTVIVGTNPLNFHFEYGGMPRRPDTLWLFCDRSSEDGGQTLACDGIAPWRALEPLARSLLQRKRLAITEPHIPE